MTIIRARINNLLDSEPVPTNWQHMSDRWSRQCGNPNSCWEVARVHEGSNLRRTGEAHRDYQDDMGIRKMGLAARALESCLKPNRADSLSDWKLQRQAARALSHVLSQQQPHSIYVVVLTAGQRSIWGTHVQALDSVWVNGKKQPRRNT